MLIAISTDHAGFEVSKQLRTFLEDLGHSCTDFGPAFFDANDDYPDLIYPAAHAVAHGECERAVILGGSGQGEAIVANRVAGIRAIVFYGAAIAKDSIDAAGNKSKDPYEIVRLSRTHNDSNVISLSSRFLDLEEMKTAIKIWLDTPFSGEARHLRRIDKIDG